MNKHHKGLLDQIKVNASSTHYKNINRYLGTPNKIYSVPSTICKKILDNFKKDNKEIPENEFYELLDSLDSGKSFEEKAFVGGLLIRYKEYRANIDLKYLDKWLTNRVGWCEIDSLCQSTFTAEEILDRWSEWEKLLRKFAVSQNISKRRASLVLLVKACRESADSRLSDLLFENIEKVKHEKDILITKAVSWGLRELVKHHKSEVKKYIDANIDNLPKIAIRETKRKIETGRK